MQVQRPGVGPGHQATLQRLQLTAAAFQNPFGGTNQYMPVRVADRKFLLVHPFCTTLRTGITTLLLLLLVLNPEQLSIRAAPATMQRRTECRRCGRRGRTTSYGSD